VKKTDKKIIVLIFVIIAVLLLTTIVYYVASHFTNKTSMLDITKKPVSTPEVIDKKETVFINPNELGIVHVELDSPSYAKSNFDVNPQTSIVVYYNTKVNSQQVLNNLNLINKNTGEETKTSVVSYEREDKDNQASYNWPWQEIWQQKLVFTPVKELESVSMYELTIRMDSDRVFSYEFMTADDPGVLSTSLKNADYKLAKGSPIKVMFRSPMDSNELSSKVVIYPEDVNFDINVVDKIMTIENANFETRSYQLVVPSDTKDIYGRELGSDFLVSFEVN